MHPVVKTLLYGQVVFYVGVLLCVLLRPAGLGANEGMSYYGTYASTFLPYALALLGAAYFAVRALEFLKPKVYNVIRLSLNMYVPLLAGIVITPVTAGRWVDYLHTTLGAVLFSLQLLLSGWLIWRLRYVWWSVALGLLEFIGGLLAAKYVAPPHGFLIQSQILFQLAFGGLLLLSLQHLSSKPLKPDARAMSR